MDEVEEAAPEALPPSTTVLLTVAACVAVAIAEAGKPSPGKVALVLETVDRWRGGLRDSARRGDTLRSSGELADEEAAEREAAPAPDANEGCDAVLRALSGSVSLSEAHDWGLRLDQGARASTLGESRSPPLCARRRRRDRFELLLLLLLLLE